MGICGGGGAAGAMKTKKGRPQREGTPHATTDRGRAGGGPCQGRPLPFTSSSVLRLRFPLGAVRVGLGPQLWRVAAVELARVARSTGVGRQFAPPCVGNFVGVFRVVADLGVVTPNSSSEVWASSMSPTSL